MAITSIGYDGSIAEGPWAQFAPTLGARYGVMGADDWKVTAKPAATHTLLIAPGFGYGDGVLDDSDAEVEVAISPGPTGTQWYAIYAHRDWTTNTTSFTYDDATSTGDFASDLASGQNPGTATNQPIALVQLVEGQTQPAAIEDVRAWQANGGAYARSEKVLQYLTEPGTRITIGRKTFTRIVTVTGAESWQVSGTAPEVYGVGATIAGGAAPVDLTGLLIQAGTAAQGTDAAGYARITFPKPFPNGLITIVLTDGDTGVDRSVGDILHYGVAGYPSWGTGNRTDVVYAVMRPRASWSNLNTGSVHHRVNWIAIGW